MGCGCSERREKIKAALAAASEKVVAFVAATTAVAKTEQQLKKENK